MRTLLAATILSFSLAAPAFAFHCPADVAKIDAALPSSSLSDAEKAEVTTLRNEGEALHNSGKHQEAVDTLAQALEKLGIQ
jgi:hypothetical protein